MPIAMPGRPVRERRDQPAAVEEAARRDHRDVDRVHDLRQQHRRRDAPGVAAALAALHDDRVRAPRRDLLGMAAGADGRDDDHARVLQLGRSAPATGPGRTTRPAPPPRRAIRTRSPRVTRVRPQIDPERRVRTGPDLPDRRAQLLRRSSWRRRECPARPAFGGGRDQPGPRHPAHAGLHDRVPHADRARSARVSHPDVRHGPSTSRSRRPSGSMTSRISRSSLGGRLPGGRDVVGRSPAGSRWPPGPARP